MEPKFRIGDTVRITWPDRRVVTILKEKRHRYIGKKAIIVSVEGTFDALVYRIDLDNKQSPWYDDWFEPVVYIPTYIDAVLEALL